MSETMKAQVENRDVAYEKRDVNPRAILWVGVAILVSAVIIHFAVWGLFDQFNRSEARKGKPPVSLVNTKRQPPSQRPRLQTDAPADLQQLRNREETALESYGWVDRERGVAHIPVERAMELLVARGLPKSQPAGNEESASQKDVKSPAGIEQGKREQR
jgi:hypothetical protein